MHRDFWHRVVAFTVFPFLFSAPMSSGDTRPIVAVFNLEAKRVKLSKGLLEELGDHLATRLTETGRYQVVPRSELKKRLLEQKKSSHRKCYDEKCQIELGRELAAELTLSAKIVKLGRKCKVNLTLYDLKKAATQAAASVGGKCGEEGIVESLEKAVNKLVGISGGSATAVAGSGSRGPAVVKWVKSRPAGLEFTKTEITIAQFRACVEAGKCEKPRETTKDWNEDCNWGYSERDAHPVNCVDWNQATAFCHWSGGKLPTDDEWYAEASVKGKNAYPWGNQEATCALAIHGDGVNGGVCGKETTWPVCSKERGNSVSGLCDMGGNVQEWTSSWLDDKKEKRIFRGGSYFNAPTNVRATHRSSYDPEKFDPSIGFRCVR